VSSDPEPMTSPAPRHLALGAALAGTVAGTVAGRPEHADLAAELRDAALRLADRADADPVAVARTAVQVIGLAGRALDLAETVRPPGPRPALGRVAAAAEALRAAVGTARVDVEVALADIADPAVREELLTAIDPVDDVVLRAAKLTALVREQIPR
jgi:formiminotetrahydrofolate cyclodeaminase